MLDTRTSRWAFAVALVLALAPAARAAEPVVRVYEVKHRPAAELLALSQTVLGEAGRASADPSGGALVLVGTRSSVDAALALLGERDRPLRQLRIRYRALSASGLPGSIEWSEHASGLRIATGRGAFWQRRGEPDRSHGYGLRSRFHRAGDFSGELLLLEGHSGRLVSERSERLYDVGLGWLLLPVAYSERVHAESGLEARATLLSEGRVRLALSAFAGDLDAEGSERSTSLRTELVVEPGESILVGAARADAEPPSAALYQARARPEDRAERVILIELDLEIELREPGRGERTPAPTE